MAQPTFRLVYRSHDLITGEARKAALGELFSQARSANKKQDITGALLVSGDSFVQVLEGEEAAVRALYEHIAADPRHDQVSLLDARPVERAVFSRWSMARVSEDGEADIPLIAHRDGIAASAGHKTTTEQDEVLAAMRAAAKGDVPAV